MRIDGGCHCGSITFEADVDLLTATICHCADCQTLSGSPYRASVRCERAAFRLLSGRPATYIKIADSGARRLQAFCSTCGTPLYATTEGDDAAPLNIRLGAVRQRAEIVPQVQIWGRSRQHWADSIEAIPRFERQRV